MIDCITLQLSHAPVQPRNRSNVTRPFPAQGLRAGNETNLVYTEAVNSTTYHVLPYTYGNMPSLRGYTRVITLLHQEKILKIVFLSAHKEQMKYTPLQPH